MVLRLCSSLSWFDTALLAHPSRTNLTKDSVWEVKKWHIKSVKDIKSITVRYLVQIQIITWQGVWHLSHYLHFLLYLSCNSMIFLSLSSWLGRVMANFDYSEVSGFHGVPVAVLKNCEPELSYISAEFFNLCLNESWSLDLLVAIFKNIWNTSATKNYHYVSLLCG